MIWLLVCAVGLFAFIPFALRPQPLSATAEHHPASTIAGKTTQPTVPTYEGMKMASGPVEIPDPIVTNRIRLATALEPDKWVSPYTGEQALAIALLNSHAAGTLDDCLRIAKNAMPYLTSMTFEIRQKA